MAAIPKACPKCGDTRAETRGRASGAVYVVYDLDDRTVDLSMMYDDVDVRGGTILYCQGCGKRLGRVEDAGDFRKDD